MQRPLSVKEWLETARVASAGTFVAGFRAPFRPTQWFDPDLERRRSKQQKISDVDMDVAEGQHFFVLSRFDVAKR